MSNSQIESQPQQLSGAAQAMCAWPLVLVFVGGVIGGALGGLAYAVNVSIYKSSMPAPAKVLCNLLAGAAAIGLWLAAAVAIQRSLAG